MRSILYTIGTALNRAADSGTQVEVLVGGAWIRGGVAAVDGHGLVLDADGEQHVVVRLESIQAVRVHASAPLRHDPHGDSRDDAEPREDGEFVMPAPAAVGGNVPCADVPVPETITKTPVRVHYRPAFTHQS